MGTLTESRDVLNIGRKRDPGFGPCSHRPVSICNEVGIVLGFTPYNEQSCCPKNKIPKGT